MATDAAPVRGRRRPRRLLMRLACAALAAPAAAWVLFLVADRLWPFPRQVLADAQRSGPGALVLDRGGRPLRAFLGAADERLFPVTPAEVNPRLVQATIAVEDRRFRRHRGVDPLALARAVLSNVRRGRVVSGASTITMQVVRRLEARPRTLTSKAVEAFRALQLERLAGKDEILTLYLNLAPYGGNLTGVEGASQTYFGKHAQDLTLAESALLAGLPKSPSRLRPDRHPEAARARRDYVLRRMRTCGFITDGELADALQQPVRAELRRFPFQAPHFAQLVRDRNPGRPLLHTTLDVRLQALCEEAVRRQVDGLRRAGVTNGAAVLVENDTGSVRALVGSCDFFSPADRGQVDGATAPRSPGSALKPFIYAMAFDAGFCAPGTMLADVPASFGGYEPENYDRASRGLATAREALTDSLNVPAVGLLRRVGQDRVYRLLRELDLSTISRPPDHYGLSLALGGADVTLLDLTGAYATLARLGVHRRCRLLETEPVDPGRRVLSEGACYLAADVLSDPERLRRADLAASVGRPLRLAWKTGTSWGHRDAWTLAWTPRYTVGVWLGNFDGRRSAALTGVQAAAPVAARILQAVHAQESCAWYARPADVAERTVCVASGMAPGPHCSATVSDLCLRDRSDRSPCTVHAEVRIDRRTGCCLCPQCAAGRSHDVRVVECWPSGVAAWLRQRDPARPLMPPHLPGCPAARIAGGGPRILSPPPARTYVATGLSCDRLLLKAAGGGQALYWFVDGRLHATGAPLEGRFWPMERGTHTVLCTDEAGRSDSVCVVVR